MPRDTTPWSLVYSPPRFLSQGQASFSGQSIFSFRPPVALKHLFWRESEGIQPACLLLDRSEIDVGRLRELAAVAAQSFCCSTARSLRDLMLVSEEIPCLVRSWQGHSRSFVRRSINAWCWNRLKRFWHGGAGLPCLLKRVCSGLALGSVHGNSNW